MYGVSFSIKAARQMGVDPKKCLEAALKDIGVKRLRLMSYWDEHEKSPGVYDFKELDWQLDLAEKYGAEVTFCLGLRQPRWPESHWPKWAENLPDSQWQAALMAYIEAVVRRYKKRRCIVSYQLENEAMLKRFGLKGNFGRTRLKQEFKLVKSLDKTRPVIMTTSDSWGLPFFGPKPDIYGFSIYRYFYDSTKNSYRSSTRPPQFYWLRAQIFRLLKWRKCFIHEMQAEPWGPIGTELISVEEQYKSMSPERVKQAVNFARATGLGPYDLWGLEWWYWLSTVKKDPVVWNYLKTVLK